MNKEIDNDSNGEWLLSEVYIKAIGLCLTYVAIGVVLGALCLVHYFLLLR